MSGLLEFLLPYTGVLALVLRVWLGANYIIHSRPKLGKEGMTRTAQFMKSVGIPPAAGLAATMLELFGGIFLIIGLIVPIVSAFFAIFMASNILMKKLKLHQSYIDPAKPSYEIDALYLGLAIVLIVLGAGALSLDGLIGL
jgi:putative oxidoreductase